MAEDKTAQSATNAGAAQAGGATKAKKEKPPAVEDKPFAEFIEQHFLPALTDALEKVGLGGVNLKFEKTPLAVQGADSSEAYWQVKGHWPQGSDRQFNIVFTKEDITGPKYFYYSQSRIPASTVEQFMGDERKITLDLMVLYTLQRLNGQKWLARN